MGNLVIEIQEAIEAGYLSFREIAQRFEVSVNDVVMVAEELNEFYNYTQAALLLEQDIGCEFDPKV